VRPLVRYFAPTARFLFQTEVHVYAFAMAANLLLSFFPFVVLILSICQNVFHWRSAVDVVYLALEDYLPSDPQLLDFVRRNLRAAVASRGRVEFFSLLLLLFSSNGVFEPLEVALNRVWGFRTNRSYWRNQWLSFGLIFVCGLLALISTLLTATNRGLVESFAGPLSTLARWMSLAVLKAIAVPVSILILFLVYWLLPNGPVPRRRVLAAAILTGLAVEAVKYLYFLLWPWLDLRGAYGPFFISATLVLWGFVASLIVLAGAELSARRAPPPAAESTA
jgi:YihY family inner membrane protein